MVTNQQPPPSPPDHLARSTIALLVSAGASGLLGVVFWIFAAHLYSSDSVGIALAEVSAMMLLSTGCQLSMATVFPRFCQQAGPQTRRLITLGYVGTATLSLAVAAAFVVLGLGRHFVPPSISGRAVFIASVPIWTIFAIQDPALTSLRAAVWVPVENVAYGVAKLLLLVAFAGVLSRTGVFIAWTLPVIAAVIAVNTYIYSRLLPGHMGMLDAASALPSSRALLTFVSGEYVASLASITLQACPALIVVSTLGPAAAAYLAVPWMFASTFYALIGSISTPLLVESVADPGARSVHVRRSAMIGMAIVIPLCVIVALGAPLLLHLLGRQYAAQGTPVLRFVAAAMPFAGVNVLYLTLARVVRRVRRSVMTQVGSSVLVNGLALLLVKGHGVAGVGFAFLTGQAIVAIVVGPSLIRQYRSLGRPGGGIGGDSAALGLPKG